MRIGKSRRLQLMRRVMILSGALLVVISFSLNAHAGGAGAGFYGMGGRISLVKPENIDATFGLGIHFDMGTILDVLRLYPSVEFWRESESTVVRGFTHETSTTELSFNGDVRHYIEMAEGSKVRPFFGGGLGLIYTGWSIKNPSRDDDGSDFDLGLNLLGGFDFRLGRSARGFLEGKFKVDGYDTFKMTFGITFPFEATE
jgi:hypothetical protein